ncbi:MAG: hypothetical protein KDK24_21700 [Pseudooceanicola sp.]|nr:hypothetical protein [Pseudooceanicola sp.]
MSKLALVLIALALAGPAAAQQADRYSTDCVMKSWAGFLHPREQSPTQRECIDLGEGRAILAYGMGELNGDYTKLSVFLLDDGQCFRKAVSAGPYAMTNALTGGPQLFHIDLYEEGLHATLSMSHERPVHGTARALALTQLQ